MSIEMYSELEKQGFKWLTNVCWKVDTDFSREVKIRKEKVEKVISFLEEVFLEVRTIGFFGPSIYDTGPKKIPDYFAVYVK